MHRMQTIECMRTLPISPFLPFILIVREINHYFVIVFQIKKESLPRTADVNGKNGGKERLHIHSNVVT